MLITKLEQMMPSKKLMLLGETEDNLYKYNMIMGIAGFINQQKDLIKELVEENERKLVQI